MKEVGKDKKGEFIYVVDRDEKKLMKMYLNGGEKDMLDFRSDEINEVLKEVDKSYRLGYWENRGIYSSVDRRKYKSNKGKGKVWRVEDGKLKYFEGKSWFVVRDNWDESKFGVLGNSGYKWVLNGRKKNNMFNVIRKYGVWLIGLMVLGRVVYKLYNMFRNVM